ncbi:rRNA methyltransferase [Candidatus Pelagibacter bacterium]|nr:rRNA methyltransferase [Candidatus Pelagibacter bacterium]
MKSNFGFILIKPQLSENIGACARSIKNFDFTNLIIVSPKNSVLNPKVKATAVGAYDIIKKAKIYDTVERAIEKFNIIVSLSARKRDVNKRHISMNSLDRVIRSNKNKKIGFMFGPEASGLSNKDLSFSNYILQIPTSKNFKSLNLSHSLTLICYEIFKILNYSKFKKNTKSIKTSTKGQISALLTHLINLLENKEFFMPSEKKQSMLLNIHNLIYRLEPSDKELRIFASIISALSEKKY